MMRLAPQSHARLEAFFRWHVRDATLRLPRIFIHAGFWSNAITGTFKVAAITVGRHLLVAPKLLERDQSGRLNMPGWLLAHEAAHVRQYEREGTLSFLFAYLHEYVGILLRGKKIGAAARMEAYLQLTREREAREVEAAYRVWHALASPTSENAP